MQKVMEKANLHQNFYVSNSVVFSLKKNLKYYLYILPGVCTPFYPANLAPISVNQTFDCLEKKQGPTVWKVLNDVHQSSIFYLHEVHMFLSQY